MACHATLYSFSYGRESNLKPDSMFHGRNPLCSRARVVDILLFWRHVKKLDTQSWSYQVEIISSITITRVVKFQTDLRGGLLYDNLTIFRLSVCTFPVTGFSWVTSGSKVRVFSLEKIFWKLSVFTIVCWHQMKENSFKRFFFSNLLASAESSTEIESRKESCTCKSARWVYLQVFCEILAMQ